MLTFDPTISTITAGQGNSGTINVIFGGTDHFLAPGESVIIDTTPPTITPSINPAPNANGWNNSPVTVSFTCNDTGSGVKTCPSSRTVTTEGKDQAVTVTAEDKAGNMASITVKVSIDITAPEAYNQFDPVTKNVQVFGRDGGSGVPAGSINSISVVQTKWGDGKDDTDTDKNENVELRTYRVTDLAGNSLVLVEKVKIKGNEIKVKIVSLQYNNGQVITPDKNEKKFEFALNKDGTLKELNQKMQVGKEKPKQNVEAKFDAKKNKTTIKVNEPKPESNVVRSGLVLLKMATDKGKLVIEF